MVMSGTSQQSFLLRLLVASAVGSGQACSRQPTQLLWYLSRVLTGWKYTSLLDFFWVFDVGLRLLESVCCRSALGIVLVL